MPSASTPTTAPAKQSRAASKPTAVSTKPAATPRKSSGRAQPAAKGKSARVSKAVVAEPAAPEVAAKAPAAAVPAAAAKPVKNKLVRDSFTMPADEYAAIGEMKRRALLSAHPAKKSELLRAGVKLLAELGDAALLAALQSLPAIKTGRPKSKKNG